MHPAFTWCEFLPRKTDLFTSAGFAALLSSALLSGCAVVYIPTGLAGDLAKRANFLGGSHCVTERATVGDTYNDPDGRSGKISGLYGASPACADPSKPVRAGVQFD